MENLENTPNRQVLARHTELLKENYRLLNNILELTEDKIQTSYSSLHLMGR